MNRKRLTLAPGITVVLVGAVASVAAADGRDTETFGLPFFPCLSVAPTASVPPTRPRE
jgi:hypothetical protein